MDGETIWQEDKDVPSIFAPFWLVLAAGKKMLYCPTDQRTVRTRTVKEGSPFKNVTVPVNKL